MKILKQERRRRTEGEYKQRGEGGEEKKEKKRRRRKRRRGGGGGGIKAAQTSEAVTLEDVSPLHQVGGSRSPPQLRHDGRARRHLPTGSSPRADPRPVEPHAAADQEPAGKINNC